jgi:hypothetical protein
MRKGCETPMTLAQEFKVKAAEASARWARACGTERRVAAERKGAGTDQHPKVRHVQPANEEWPISERARWLPALAIAIGIIYGADESRSDLPSCQSPPAE